jgi:tetratricopeptide (TPR) repeat protein
MAERLLEDDPALAWEHAKAAVARGGRLSVVREAAGVTAYAAGEYADALAQFRAARRISGSDSYWPIMADCERGLGRPERAIAMAGAPEADRLDRGGRVELRIVASGARRDLGQIDAAVVTLQCPELTSNASEPWVPRLRYAYADALLTAGREDEARDWFVKTIAVDPEGTTEAEERLAELDGLVFEDALDEDEIDDELDEGLDEIDDELDEGLDEDDDELEGDGLEGDGLEGDALEEDGLDDGSDPDGDDDREQSGERSDEVDDLVELDGRPPAQDSVVDPVVGEASSDDSDQSDRDGSDDDVSAPEGSDADEDDRHVDGHDDGASSRD